MKRKIVISAAICAVMFATSTILSVSAASVDRPVAVPVQSDIPTESSNTYSLIELVGADDWEIFFNYVDENNGIFIKKYSEEFNTDKAVYVDPDDIDAPITLTSGEFTLVDREGKIIPHKPFNSTFSVCSSGESDRGSSVISKFYFSLVKGPAGEGGKRGDVNKDGIINITDIVKVTAHVKGVNLLQDDRQKHRADVNNDNKIDVTDIVKVAAHIKGKKPLSKA